MEKNNSAYVFNIQRYSVHDGPGIRTLVFLKGCPLRCRWCCNPESQSFAPELAYNNNKCIGVAECAFCIKACSPGAISANLEGKIDIDRKKCDNCFKCVEVCPSRALSIFGRLMTIDEILQEIEKDNVFYNRSGGGLTLSGGEPLAQADFVVELLKEARQKRINTCLETSGYTTLENLLRVSQFLDSIYYDIKCLDDKKHKEYTGVSNKLIIANLQALVKERPDLNITVRTPVVPGFNDNEGEIRAIAEFVKGLSGVQYELLGYHRLGEPKYGYIGREYLLKGVKPLAKERLEELRNMIKAIFTS